MAQLLGAMAQLVAHHTGSVGVMGSNPLSSTKKIVGQMHKFAVFSEVSAPSATAAA